MKSFSPRIYGRRIKKPSKKLAQRRRHLSLTSNDQVVARRLKLIISVLLVRLKTDEALTKDERQHLENLLRIIIVSYLHQVTYEDEEHDKTPSRERTISSFSNSECNTLFRFHKEDLVNLVDWLKFPKKCVSNGIVMPGEEILLRCLYELSSGETKHKVAINIFGRDGSAQSRAFTYFINHIIVNFENLLSDNLEWWFRNGFAKESAEAFEHKMGMTSGDNTIVGFLIDCNCLESTRVGGGPAEDGANSARWNAFIQRAFYNGWKSINGLKHQTVDVAHGFCVDIFGPTSLRRNDMRLFSDSNINDRIAALQLDELMQMVMFGDSAYLKLSHTRSYIKDGNEADKRWNRHARRVRVSIEWNYGATASLFPYLQVSIITI
jgi:hypothetical protein